MPDELLFAVLAALIGAVPGLLALVMQRRKQRAEVEKLKANAVGSLTDTALDLVTSLREEMRQLRSRTKEQALEFECLREKLKNQAAEMERLQDRLDRMVRLMRELLEGIARRAKQVESLGGHPVYVVPVYEETDDLA